MENVIVKSKQKDIKVTVEGVIYEFGDTPIEMPKDTAERLICGKLVDDKHIKGSDRFELVPKKNKKKVD